MNLATIPQDAYIRLRFELYLENFFRTLAEQLQSNAENVFFAQHNPRSGLGSCPFHVKLLPPASLSEQSCSTVSNILQSVASKFASVRGQVLPVCTVDNEGLVSLRINSSGCRLINRFLTTLVADTDHDRIEEDYFLVSIGRFQGPHTKAFEVWLNKELTKNSAVFPAFQCHYIEVSEECNTLIQGPLRLLAEPNSEPLISNHSSKKNDNSKETFKPVHSSDGYSSRAGSDKKITLENRLLTSVNSLTHKIGGLGTIWVDQIGSESVSTLLRCCVVPNEMKKWQEQCLKVFIMLDGMLQAVGPKDFINTLDFVANPLSKTIMSVLQPWVEKGFGSLKLTLIDDLRVSALTTLGGNNIAELNGKKVTLNCFPMATRNSDILFHDVDCGNISRHSFSQGTDSALLCFPVRQAVHMTANDSLNTHDTWRILIALHICDNSLTSANLRPLEGLKQFHLPIGWIDGMTRRPSRNVTQQNVPIRSNPIQDNLRPSHTRGNIKTYMRGEENDYIYSNTQSAAYSSGKISVDRSYAGQQNYQGHDPLGYLSMKNVSQSQGSSHNNISVLHHRQANPSNSGSGPGSGQGAMQETRKSFASYPNQQLALSQAHSLIGKVPHPGDWICTVCDALVFSFRSVCYNCNAIQPDSDHQVLPRQPPRTADRPEGDLREGDWLCPGCQGHNFSNKIACFTCRMPRTPSSLSAYASSSNIVPRENVAGKVTRAPAVMPGDWTCPTCNENVFKKRHRCYKCSTSKPR